MKRRGELPLVILQRLHLLRRIIRWNFIVSAIDRSTHWLAHPGSWVNSLQTSWCRPRSPVYRSSWAMFNKVDAFPWDAPSCSSSVPSASQFPTSLVPCIVLFQLAVANTIAPEPTLYFCPSLVTISMPPQFHALSPQSCPVGSDTSYLGSTSSRWSCWCLAG